MPRFLNWLPRVTIEGDIEEPLPKPAPEPA